MERLKKSWLTFAFSLCVGLLLATACLLFTPATVFADDDFAGGSAKCAGGTVVRCDSGASGCHCTDYDGCTSTMPDGTTKTTKCDTPLLD